LEAMPRILPGLDREISQNLSMILKKRGINIHTGAKVTAVTRQDESPQQGGSLPRANLQVCFEEKEKTNELAAAGVLVAIGRKPQTDGLFANGLSPQTERGFLVVDRQYQTSLPGIYAVGDVIGGIQLAHAAAAEGISAVEQMAGHSAAEQEMLIPSCVYSDPEIAAVGLTEEAAKQAGRFIKVGKCIMSANGKSLIEDLDRGFIKLIFDGESEVLLGAQLMCGRATDLISELTTAIANKLTKAQLAAVIRPHPTFSEAVTEAVESVDGRAIHIMPRR
jgi:dihydrolipoamide dehydrogenase